MNLPPIIPGSGPLLPPQAEALNAIFAQLSSDQASWLCGFLAGVSQAGTASGVVPAVSSGGGTEHEITILYGSQTGNAEKLAQKAAAAAQANGSRAVVMSMQDCKAAKLKKISNLMVIVSTHGEGDPPDNAIEFHEFLHGKRAPKLDAVRFSVLALGDSSYEHYCKTGADFDARLAELGAERIHARVDCDLDYDDAAEGWTREVLAHFSKVTPGVSAPPVAFGSPAGALSLYSKKNPFDAEVLSRINLNGRGSDKETWHVELSLEDSGLTYQPGDALGILPRNNPRYVEELIAISGWNGSDSISTSEGDLSLQEGLERLYEITTVTRPALKKYAEMVKSKALLDLFADDQRDALSAYLYGREWIDIFADHRDSGLSAADFFSLIRKLPPRLYSIASCLEAHPDEVHLTIGATRYQSLGRTREGVCSTFVADRIEEGDRLQVYIDGNANFKPPTDPSRPMIMIGPGTGIAPFRSFVAHREATGASGKNWLFFGDQHFTTDFLYQTEWQNWLKHGTLHRLDVAFSRDQKEKVYVQHRMREQAKELYGWLQDGAAFYVCGDEKRMSHDVHQTLLQIIAEEGGTSLEEAEHYVKEMSNDKRYQRDVY